MNSPFRRVVPVHAVLRTCGIKEHDANPLISSLPAIRSVSDWRRQLACMPDDPSLARALPSETRVHYVHQLKRLYIPHAESVQLATRVDMLLRAGLLSRNPKTTALADLLQQVYATAQRGSGTDRVTYSEEVPIASFSLFGVSGMGKTTAIANVLSAYPQYIVHDDLNLHHVVWLRVETPKGGGLRDLTRNILRAFDEVLGSQHASDISKNATVDELMDRVNSLVVTHVLGLLVVDELQNLTVRKSQGREDVLNFFQELLNALKVPLIVMGTPKVQSLFDSELRHTRRLAVDGSALWMPLKRGSTYDVLVEQLWELLVLRDAGELSEDMRDVIFDETQGIRALIADMLLVAQLRALHIGRESITPDFLRETARSEFTMVQRFIKALRTKDPRQITRYEDLSQYRLDEVVKRTNEATWSAAEEGAGAAKQTNSFVDHAVEKVALVIGGGPDRARSWVMKALEEGTPKTAAALTSAAIRLYTTSESAASPA